MHNQKSLVDKLLQASQKIQQSSLRGSANCVVLNSESKRTFTAVYRIDKIKRIFSL
jgi:hypothetical protein